MTRLLATALLALGVCPIAPAVADPGQPVVQATVYPASAGSAFSQTVTLGSLETCPLYTGSSPMYLYPGDQPYSPATGSSWAVSTVLSCALRRPSGEITEVQVDNPPHGFEAPLSAAQLSDPSQFHDPSAPDALPVISVDGTENQNTYVRPWLGGSDANAGEQVIADGSPITIVVWENRPPLSVAATTQTISRSSAALAIRFSATVHAPDGSAVPGSALTWSWDFGDGRASSAASPRHTFSPGVYPVTVQVTDNHSGTGGTATLEVTFSSSSARGSHRRPGAGRSKRGQSPSGPEHSTGTHAAGTPGTRSTGAAGSPSTRQQPRLNTSSSHRPRQAAHMSTTAHHRQPVGSHQGHRPAPATGGTRPSRPGTAQAAGPVVAGRLISNVVLLPPAESPLLANAAAQSVAAPAVRAAVSASILPALLAGLSVLALFGLGVARELHGPLRWRPRRPHS